MKGEGSGERHWLYWLAQGGHDPHSEQKASGDLRNKPALYVTSHCTGKQRKKRRVKGIEPRGEAHYRSVTNEGASGEMVGIYRRPSPEEFYKQSREQDRHVP